MSRTVIVLALASLMAVPAAAGAHLATIKVQSHQTSLTHTTSVITFTEKLTIGTKVAGHDRVTCTNASTAICNAVFTFKGGTVNVKGTFKQSQVINTLKITGGTGTYKGARGTLTLMQNGQNAFLETLKFT